MIADIGSCVISMSSSRVWDAGKVTTSPAAYLMHHMSTCTCKLTQETYFGGDAKSIGWSRPIFLKKKTYSQLRRKIWSCSTNLVGVTYSPESAEDARRLFWLAEIEHDIYVREMRTLHHYLFYEQVGMRSWGISNWLPEGIFLATSIINVTRLKYIMLHQPCAIRMMGDIRGCGFTIILEVRRRAILG